MSSLKDSKERLRKRCWPARMWSQLDSFLAALLVSVASTSRFALERERGFLSRPLGVQQHKT